MKIALIVLPFFLALAANAKPMGVHLKHMKVYQINLSDQGPSALVELISTNKIPGHILPDPNQPVFPTVEVYQLTLDLDDVVQHHYYELFRASLGRGTFEVNVGITGEIANVVWNTPKNSTSIIEVPLEPIPGSVNKPKR